MNFECGHIIAVAMGGRNTLANLRPICAACNRSMGTQNMLEFKKLLEDADDLCDAMQEVEISASPPLEQALEPKEESSEQPGTSASHSKCADTLADADADIEVVVATVAESLDRMEIRDDVDDDPREPCRISRFFNRPQTFFRELTTNGTFFSDADRKRYARQTISHEELYGAFLAWCDWRCLPKCGPTTFAEDARVLLGDMKGIGTSEITWVFSRERISVQLEELRAQSTRGNLDDLIAWTMFNIPRAFIEDIALGRVAQFDGAHGEFAIAREDLYDLFCAWCRTNYVPRAEVPTIEAFDADIAAVARWHTLHAERALILRDPGHEVESSMQ